MSSTKASFPSSSSRLKSGYSSAASFASARHCAALLCACEIRASSSRRRRRYSFSAISLLSSASLSVPPFVFCIVSVVITLSSFSMFPSLMPKRFISASTILSFACEFSLCLFTSLSLRSMIFCTRAANCFLYLPFISASNSAVFSFSLPAAEPSLSPDCGPLLSAVFSASMSIPFSAEDTEFTSFFSSFFIKSIPFRLYEA